MGWPPISTSRMNSLVSQAKAPIAEEEKSIGGKDKSKDGLKRKVCDGTECSNVNDKGNLGSIKVYMDGLPIGRKVDLNAHGCYETLALALETMFFKSTPHVNGIGEYLFHSLISFYASGVLSCVLNRDYFQVKRRTKLQSLQSFWMDYQNMF